MAVKSQHGNRLTGAESARLGNVLNTSSHIAVGTLVCTTTLAGVALAFHGDIDNAKQENHQSFKGGKSSRMRGKRDTFVRRLASFCSFPVLYSLQSPVAVSVNKTYEGSQEVSLRRRLYYFPIIHTPSDMGALGEAIRKAHVKKAGNQSWRRHLQLVDRLWTQIEECITVLSLPYSRLRLYQDGLPECGREHEIVRELAQAGSRNHRLLLELQHKGAILMGTEAPPLLREEYEQTSQDLMAAHGSGAANRHGRNQKAALRKSLLQQRDRHIALRINSTLQRGETGLLFLGALHSLTTFLNPDIHVIFPLGQGRTSASLLPSKRSSVSHDERHIR